MTDKSELLALLKRASNLTGLCDSECEGRCRECPATWVSDAITELKRRLTEPSERETLYNELILAVGNKYPGETRHQTALRYITNAERTHGPSADAAYKEGK